MMVIYEDEVRFRLLFLIFIGYFSDDSHKGWLMSSLRPYPLCSRRDLYHCWKGDEEKKIVYFGCYYVSIVETSF